MVFSVTWYRHGENTIVASIVAVIGLAHILEDAKTPYKVAMVGGFGVTADQL